MIVYFTSDINIYFQAVCVYYWVWCYLLVVIVPVKGKGVAHEIAGVFVESVFLKQKEFQCLPTEKDTENNIVIKKNMAMRMLNM